MGVSKNRGVSQNGWFIMENPIEMDDLGEPPFKETPIYRLGCGFRHFLFPPLFAEDSHFD